MLLGKTTRDTKLPLNMLLEDYLPKYLHGKFNTMKILVQFIHSRISYFMKFKYKI